MTLTLTFRQESRGTESAYLGEQKIGEVSHYHGNGLALGRVEAWWRSFLPCEFGTHMPCPATSYEKAKELLAAHIEEWLKKAGMPAEKMRVAG